MITFQEAVQELQKGNKITRKCWDQSNAKVCIGMQFPDENSFMTTPYMYQEINGTQRSPMELTWGLVTATDWYIIDMSPELGEPVGLAEEKRESEEFDKRVLGRFPEDNSNKYDTKVLGKFPEDKASPEGLKLVPAEEKMPEPLTDEECSEKYPESVEVHTDQYTESPSE